MRPKDIIEMLASAKGTTKGKLWFTSPMTNIPLDSNDTNAGKILKAMDAIMPEKSTVQDHINALTEAIWWIIFFSAMQNEEAFLPEKLDET
jgi:hypothetical protein